MTVFSAKAQKSDFLIAEPFLKDSIFKRSVILITEIGEFGTVGFILNKPIEGTYVSDLFKDFPTFNAPVYMGGPVSQENLYYIHSYPTIFKNSLHICDDIYIGGDFEILKDNIRDGIISSSKIKFFLGYSGWDKNQLESELKTKDWIVDTFDKAVLFNSKTYNSLWQFMLKNKGGKYTEMANYPNNPSLN